MARRKTRGRKTRRRSKSGINLINAAELYITTGVLTQAAFGVDPLSFVTGRTSGFGSSYNGSQPEYQMNMYRPSNDGTMITLPELLGVDSQGAIVPFGGFGGALVPQMQSNVAAYGGLGKVAINTVLIKAGFTVAKKLTSKQRSATNKGLKMLGLKGTVSV
jgi:hypothetical protein